MFVARGAGHFEPRDVVVGRSVDGKTVVVDGLREDEEVVTRATFFIDSESKVAAALQSYDGPTSVSPTSAGEPLDFDVRVATKPDPPRQGENELKCASWMRESSRSGMSTSRSRCRCQRCRR